MTSPEKYSCHGAGQRGTAAAKAGDGVNVALASGIGRLAAVPCRFGARNFCTHKRGLLTSCQ